MHKQVHTVIHQTTSNKPFCFSFCNWLETEKDEAEEKHDAKRKTKLETEGRSAWDGENKSL